MSSAVFHTRSHMDWLDKTEAGQPGQGLKCRAAFTARYMLSCVCRCLSVTFLRRGQFIYERSYMIREHQSKYRWCDRLKSATFDKTNCSGYSRNVASVSALRPRGHPSSGRPDTSPRLGVVGQRIGSRLAGRPRAHHCQDIELRHAASQRQHLIAISTFYWLRVRYCECPLFLTGSELSQDVSV